MTPNRYKVHGQRFYLFLEQMIPNKRLTVLSVLLLLGLISLFTFRSYAQSSYTEYMPWVKSKRIAEYPTRSCRWPHTPGTTLTITYKWGNNLQGSSLWRTAFEQGLSEWNSQAIKPEFTHSNSGNVDIDTYYSSVASPGFSQPTCQGASTVSYIVRANTFWTSLTALDRRLTATHELGHAMSVKHIPGCDAITVMSYCNPDWNTYYTVTPNDVEFINQFYP